MKVPGCCPQLGHRAWGQGFWHTPPPTRPALGPLLLAVPRTGKGQPPAQGDLSTAVHTPPQAWPPLLYPQAHSPHGAWGHSLPLRLPLPSRGRWDGASLPPGAKLATAICTLLWASKAEMKTPGGGRTERPPHNTWGPEDLPREPQPVLRGPTPGTRPCLLMPQRPPKWQGTWARPHAGHMGVVLARAHQGHPLSRILGERRDAAWMPGGPQRAGQRTPATRSRPSHRAPHHTLQAHTQPRGPALLPLRVQDGGRSPDPVTESAKASSGREAVEGVGPRG